ncbi:glycosyltransferase family 2 protein [Prevotella sp. KH2C16]|uniref:glycosyltransferase family 2 protein n=1 Tax=Prevotella sp. KH2C16 TaxID=1855325 RepID=UPI0008E18A2D|nr:glycosyltransferase family 2 protein [Prevotella sp. KH2C16]SFG36669.1 Glycosyltransferase involved in cell wall bisynthesis [Prevotella sp. KH2C16]
MIKFTIITCTFNAQSVVRRTLVSVLEQSYPHVEHLIIDGKSKDATMQLVADYATESAGKAPAHEIKTVCEPDKGLYDAMNKGLRLASGDYLVYLNAGDVFPSKDTLEHIAHAVGEAEELPGVLYGDTDIVDGDGWFIRHRRLSPPRKLSWKSFVWGMLVCHQAFYARTDLAKAHPYNLQYRYSADVDWCIRIMRDAGARNLPLRNVHAVVVNFLDGGMTTANHKASLKERFQVMKKHYGLFATLFAHAWFAVRAVFKE